MKRTALLPLVLLLIAPAAPGAARKTLMKRARQQAHAAVKSVGRELKSWMAAMRGHVGGIRKGIAQSADSVTDAGARGIEEIKDTMGTLGRQTRQQVHKGMTAVAREFVPVGERVTVRPETTVAETVESPIGEPAFLRRYDIELAWQINLAGRPIRRSMVMENQLVLEDAGADVYALSARNGIANWVFPLPAESQYDFAADEDAIIVIAKDTLYDLDLDVGLPRNRFVLPFPSSCRPAIHGDSVVLASADDRLYSLNRETRVREWSFLAADHILAGMVVRANTVYYAQVDGQVFAYPPGSRRPLWQYKADDAVLVTLAAEGDNLYFPARDLFVHALNRLGGFRVWKFPVRGQVTQPVWTTEETVYFAADGDGFYAVSREEGEMLWNVPGARWPVAVGQKNIYLEGPDQSLLAVSRDTGKQVWSVSAKPFTYFVRNTRTDYIYLVTDAGQVYAFYLRGDHLEEKKEEKPPLRPPVPGVEEPAARAPAPAGPADTEPQPAEKAEEDPFEDF